MTAPRGTSPHERPPAFDTSIEGEVWHVEIPRTGAPLARITRTRRDQHRSRPVTDDALDRWQEILDGAKR